MTYGVFRLEMWNFIFYFNFLLKYRILIFVSCYYSFLFFIPKMKRVVHFLLKLRDLNQMKNLVDLIRRVECYLQF